MIHPQAIAVRRMKNLFCRRAKWPTDFSVMEMETQSPNRMWKMLTCSPNNTHRL